MTATDGIRQWQPATEGVYVGDDPQLARARDVDATPAGKPLPDTQRDRRVGGGWLDGARETAALIWSGEVWDIQPPSPRELVDRGRDSAWADSGKPVKVSLAWVGVGLAISWSVPWYTVAVLGQRFGRAIVTVSLLWLIWVLL